MTDDWPDDLPAMRKAEQPSELDDLVASIPNATPACFAMWSQGENLHFEWFGLDNDDVLRLLENMVHHLKHDNGPSPTRH